MSNFLVPCKKTYFPYSENVERLGIVGKSEERNKIQFVISL